MARDVNMSPVRIRQPSPPPLVYFLLDLPAALFHESVTSEGLQQQQKPEARCNVSGRGSSSIERNARQGGCSQRVNLIWHIMQHMAPICFQLNSFRPLGSHLVT
jgi:hypothetical protein